MGRTSHTEIAPTITTRTSSDNNNFIMERNMNEDKKTKVAMTLDEGKWAKMHEQSRRVCDTDGIAPTQHCNGGGNLEPKIVEPICLNSKVNGKQPSVQDRIYSPEGTSTAITTCFHVNIQEPFVAASRGREPKCLTPKRTEYGKAIRKQYEAHEVTEQRKNIQKLEPRTDGITNTLTSVQKDNLLCEPNHFRIRKLTPRECFRLMDVDDKDIDTIQAAGISDSQQYKLAGNSIFVNVLTEIFRKLLVDTQADDGQMILF